MTSATADCSAVAPLTTPVNECRALADTHSTFALIGLASDNQQRTTPILHRARCHGPASTAFRKQLGINGSHFVIRGKIVFQYIDNQHFRLH
jgi:hypothetical protein